MKDLCLALALSAFLMIAVLAPLAAGCSQDHPASDLHLGVEGKDQQPPRVTTVYPWPMYHYNETHASVTASPSPDDSSTYWYNSTGQTMHSSPTIAEGKVFIGMGDPSGDSMLAFYINNGTLAWRRTTYSQVPGGYGVGSTPAYSNGVLFFAADRIYALYASNGTVKWSVPLPYMTYGGGTATVAQGRVFVGGSDYKLYAVDQSTGTVLWTSQPFSTSPPGGNNYGLHSPPSVWSNYVYIAACDGYVYQFNTTQPGPTANYYHRSAGYRTMYGSPTIYNGKIYIGDGYYSDGSGLSRFRALWASNLTQAWAFTPPIVGSFFSSASVAYNKVFIGSTNGNLYALDPSNGAIIWNYQTGGAVWSSPAISDGKLFVGSNSNSFYSLNANQTNPAITRWSFGLGGDVISAPAISDGRACVGTFGNGGRIYCFGTPLVPPDNPPAVEAWEPGGASGQTYSQGQLAQVRWNATDDNPMPPNNINISYGNVPVWNSIVTNTANDGVQPWDTTAVPLGTYSIRVTAYDSRGQQTEDIGNFTFQIVAPDSPPSVLAWEPGGAPGQTITRGQAVQIRWLVTDDNPMPASSVNISYGNSPTWNDIVRNTANDGSEPWDTSGVTPGVYSIRVTAYDSKGQESEDIGNFTFQIVPPSNQRPTITIDQPAGGESWTGGSIHAVDWTASDLEDVPGSLRVWVNYSLTGSPPFNLQIPGLQGVAGDAGPYAWTVPFENSALVVLNATVVDTAGGKGFGDSLQFEIDSMPPQVSSTNPINGASGVPTSTGVIATWSERMLAASVQSAFSLRDTALWTPVVGTFMWAGNTMTFTPGGLLSPGTEYSANFTTLAKDDSDSGNNLLSPYVWMFTTASSADTTRPTIMGATAIPDPQEVKLSVNVSAIVQDDTSVGLVRLNVTDPIGGTSNTTMSYDVMSGKYYLGTTCNLLGTHAFVIWASDTSGNWNWTSGQFTCVDTTAPTVSDPMAVPDPAEVFSQVDISALISDNYQVVGAWVEVTAPDMSSANQTMNPGARYSRQTSADQLGTYIYRISATDENGQWGVAQSQFSVIDTTRPAISNLVASPNPVQVRARTNLSAIVTDNYQLVGVWVEVTAPDLTSTNQSMSLGARYYFNAPANQLGTYAFKVSAVDGSSNWNAASSTFTSVDLVPPVIDHTPTAAWIISSIINITVNVTDNVHVQEVWLDFTDTAGTPHNVSMAHSQQDEYFYVVPTQPQVGTLAYHFWAVDQSGNGARSAQFSSLIQRLKPDSPASLVATLEGCNAIRLLWVAPTTNDDGSPLTNLVGYNIFRSEVMGTDGIRLNTDLVQGTAYLDSNLGSNITYYYTVRAVNSIGVESEYSNEAYAITPASCGSNEPGENTSPLLLMIIVLMIVIAVIVSIIVVLLVKRRKKERSESEAKSDPAQDAKKDDGKKAK